MSGGIMIEQNKAAAQKSAARTIANPEALPKAYEPRAVEGKWYRFWEEGGYFKPRGDATRPTFVISMPPPNVTGALHLGHAITATIEDILIRYHRMQGDDTLWVPGEDHAGIATQTVVERLLAQEGTDRHEIGREAFLERVWQWVNHIDTPGKLTYVRYPLKPLSEGEPAQYISVATTRPETILGDTAVAVNPKDTRYKDLVGRLAILPVIGREIPIITDEAVDPTFGTGAVKVTPAHDPTDFEIGLRHDLPRVQVIGFDAKMTDEAGPYAGQDRYEARDNLVADLEKLGLVIKIEDYMVPLGYCQRCDSVVEPLISKQWFVKMAPLATPAIGAVKYGLLKIVPERFNKVYLDWLENIHDWCISRQLWWGHRIPVWYCDNCGQMTVSLEDISICPHCDSTAIHQDEDVLDTWFSSWLWPFSTLGWPELTADLGRYYPTTVMETGYDIIFFWVARMVMTGIHFLGVIPFHTIYLHGLVRDARGEKMSKSKNNVVDRLEVMDKYGTEALRFTLATSSAPGNDMKLVEERIVGNRNFANKIWNASRFVLMTTAEIGRGVPAIDQVQPQTLADHWILSRLAKLALEVTRLIDEFQLGEAGRQVNEFFWSDY